MAQQGFITKNAAGVWVQQMPDGTEVPLRTASTLLQQPVPQEVPPSNTGALTPEDLKNLIIMGGKGVETAAGFVPHPAARTLLSGIAGAGVGGLEGGVQGAVDRASLNMGGEMLGHWGSEAIPRAGLNLGLWLGSLRGTMNERIGDITDAFMRVREATGGNFFKEIPIGAQNRTQTALKEAGNNLQRLEESVPGRPINLETFRDSIHVNRDAAGFPVASGGDPGYVESLATSSLPLTKRTQAQAELDRILDEHAYIRPGTGLRLRGQAPAPGITAYDPNVSVRDAREIARAVRNEAPGPQAIINRRQAGEMVEEGADVNAHVRDLLARDINTVAEGEAAMAGVNLRQPTQNVSDLLTMQNVNRSLRAGGTTMRDVGLISVRGGLGAGLFGGIGRLLGLDPMTSGALGGLLGISASPSNISRAGYLGGRMAGVAPTAARSYDLASDIDEGVSSPVQRRAETRERRRARLRGQR